MTILFQDIMEGRILTSDVRLSALEAEDAFRISKIAKYVQRIDKQVNTEFLLLPSYKILI